MCLTHGTFGDRICKHTDLRKHINDRTLCSARREVFNHIKSYRTSADYDDFFALTGFIRVFSCIQVIDHIKDRSHISGLNVLFQPFNRWNKRHGTCCIYNDIRFELFYFLNSCLCVQENIKIFQSCSTCFQIFREIFHTSLARKIRNKCRKTAKVIFFLQNKNITSNFSSCTCCFQSGCSATYYYNIAVFVDFECFINIAFRYSRVDGTTDRTVYADTVSCTSNIT